VRVGPEATEDALDAAATDDEKIRFVVGDRVLDAFDEGGFFEDFEIFGEVEIGGDGLIVFESGFVDELMGPVGGGAGKTGVGGMPVDDADGGVELAGDFDGRGENVLRLGAAIDGAEYVFRDGGEKGGFGMGAGPDGDSAVVEDAGDDGAEEELAKAGVAVGGEHDQRDAVGRGVIGDGGTGAAVELEAADGDFGEGVEEEGVELTVGGFAEGGEFGDEVGKLDGEEGGFVDVEEGDVRAGADRPAVNGGGDVRAGGGEIDGEEDVGHGVRLGPL